jgi:alpha-mannosidase
MPGIWNFDYSILSHPGDWQKAFPDAYGFIAPFKVINASIHKGNLPSLCSFVQVNPAALIISAIKHTDDGRSMLVRGYNISNETIKVDIKPWRGFKKVDRVNLAEKISKSLRPGKDGVVTFLVRGHEIVSLRFQD